MKRQGVLFVLLALAAGALLAGCWGSSKDTSLDVAVAPTPAKVGSAQCTNTCHAATTDILGEAIAATWTSTTHTGDFGVQCEDCHGGGGNHWGVGPIPYSNPSAASCASAACHGLTNPTFVGFSDTAHANGNQTPDGSFSQISTSAATGRHIEECSVCHSPNQRFAFDSSDNLLKPNPDDLPNPAVTCGSCHDGHQVADNTTTVPQRANAKVYFPRFRPFIVNATGEQSASGSSVRASIFQANGAVKSTGTLDNTSVVGTNNELNVERLCASCHTKGLYKNSGGATHQKDIYTEWKESGHGERDAPAFAEFSANPTAYTNPNTGLPYGLGDHQSSYPFDMALTTTNVTGPATTAKNAGQSNYACFKCHHGLGSLAYQDNVEGTAAAPVLFGDATVTCITCHDPHTDVTGNTKNTRKPLVMSKYSSTQTTFQGNVFFDNTAVPSATGNATICVFCHQGRESGFTLFKRRIATGTTVTGSFLNPHYLGTGAMLWARNGYEYTDNSTGTPVPKQYGYVSEHQETNCNGCHMASSTTSGLGGHTWKIVSDDDSAVNSTTCNAVSCHNGRVPTTNSAGQMDSFYDNVVATIKDYDGDGTVEGIAQEITGLENHLISLLDNNGITYNDASYPYFFIKGTSSSFTAWTRPKLKAAFNLQYVIKGLPSGPSQIGQPNRTAAVHNYRYIIQLLMDSYENLYNNTSGASGLGLPTPAALTANRPSGIRDATNYNPQSGGAYDSLQ